jgi:predicted nucleic acid-binding Zn ribbon protein
MLSADQPPLDPTDTAAGTPLCEAPGCDRRLTPVQVRKDARACSAACRARAYRERRRQARLAEIDAAVKVLLELRAEIAGG